MPMKDRRLQARRRYEKYDRALSPNFNFVRKVKTETVNADDAHRPGERFVPITLPVLNIISLDEIDRKYGAIARADQ